MPGGAALLTQASLPHCNTGSLIRYNKRGNEVRQREETSGKAFERRRPRAQNGSLSSLKLCQSSWSHMEKNYHTSSHIYSENGHPFKSLWRKRWHYPYIRSCLISSSTATLAERLIFCGKDLPQPFTVPCSSLSHPGSRVLHGTSTSNCPYSAFLPFCLSTLPSLHLHRRKGRALLIGDQGTDVAPVGGLLLMEDQRVGIKCERFRQLLKG